MLSPKFRFFAFLTGFALAATAKSEPAPTSVYFDSSKPLETRVVDLVGRLTLEEKASLMSNGSPGVARLGIPRYDWWNEALHGVARAGEATVFPQAIALAAAWDDAFMQRVADTISTEARAKYSDAIAHNKRERYFGLTFWTPNINIFRDPRWGRGQETYGEDPFLTGQLGVAFVRGLQGDDPRYLKTAACAKHFVVHSGPEPSRHTFNVDPDDADFHETYLPAFERLVREAKVETVMTAYNSVYGQPCSINPKLYDLLYNEWGFNGHVVSDCGSVHDLYANFKVAHDPAEAEAMVVRAGLCLTCGTDSPALVEAVKRGLVTEAEIDVRLGQLLRTMFRLGFFDKPDAVSYSAIPFSENNSPGHAALALEAAQKSIVLLKNNGVLPLDPAHLKRIAVIGPNADSLAALLGNYNGTPTKPVTVLAGLKAALGDRVAIDYVRGCDFVSAKPGAAIIPRSVLHSGDSAGLPGEYFANRQLEGTATVQRREREIELNFRQGNPVAGLPSENFSARWTGKLQVSTGGKYQLVVSGNGGFRLFVRDQLAVDAWNAGEKTKTVDLQLKENEDAPIRLEYYQADAPAEIYLKWIVPDAAAGFDEAIARAKAADAVIFVGGITAQLEGEEMRIDYEGFNGGDRTRVELPTVQEKLLQALHATGKPVVFVLMSGSAVAIPWENDHLPAIVQAWYPGQAGGTALADVLFGKVNPSGRLPITFYRSTEDLPAFDDYRMAGRTYRYFTGKPLYPFGHGLSYTRFDYAKLQVVPARTADAKLTATVEITNRGQREGDEVVQLYAQEPIATHPRAQKSLCGFQRVHLQPGETKMVTINVTGKALQRWNTEKKAYAVLTGEWHFQANASSEDVRQTASFAIVNQ